jgi:hypothetical protein
MDHGKNFVDLADPSEPPAPKEEEDDWSFDLSGDDGSDDGDADNLDYHAFRGGASFFVFSSNSSHFCIKLV